jgi:cysteine synthase A
MNKSICTSLCGNTPLIRISDNLYAKLETYNPSGSVKDRMISYVVNKAISRGEISLASTLCDATSGNTGIALSMVAASLGLPCVIFMPSNMSEERKQMMRVYGATIIDAPPDNFGEAIYMRDEFLARHSNAWSPMQFSNYENIECHLLTTAPEIAKNVSDLGLPWSAFVHGSGTGGTIEGVRRYTVNKELPVKIIMSQPEESPHGIQGIADGKEFLALDKDMDGSVRIKTSEAIARAKLFARSTGILAGISSGANLLASERWIEKNSPVGIVVTMLCDRGERYMSVYEGV